MQCFTVEVEKQSPVVQNGLTRRYSAGNNGLFACIGSILEIPGWLKKRLRSKSHTRLRLTKPLLTDSSCYHYGEQQRLVIWRCSLDRAEQGNVVLRPEALEDNAKEALVLVRFTADGMEDKPVAGELGQGFVADIGSTTEGGEFVNSIVYERLVMIKPGQTIRITANNFAPRCFGLSVHRGTQITIEFTYDGHTVSAQEVSILPGAEPLVSFRNGSVKDFAITIMSALTGGMFGLSLSSPPDINFHACLIGAVVGAALMVLAIGFRALSEFLQRPKYSGF